MNREALRQQQLVRALWRDDMLPPEGLRVPARAGAASPALAAYRANAGALAERALGSAYPTVAALVGSESFAALARHLWHAHPPTHGDIGLWGDALPGFIPCSAQLADVPYLADSARLDWAVHLAARAADADWRSSLDALADADPARLRLQLAPGAALLTSRHPIATVWRAHHADAPFDDARRALDAQRGEHAFVWRDRCFAVQVQALNDADAAFTRALLDGHALAPALDAAGADFAFERWLAHALAADWIAAAAP